MVESLGLRDARLKQMLFNTRVMIGEGTVRSAEEDYIERLNKDRSRKRPAEDVAFLRDKVTQSYAAQPVDWPTLTAALECAEYGVNDETIARVAGDLVAEAPRLFQEHKDAVKSALVIVAREGKPDGIGKLVVCTDPRHFLKERGEEAIIDGQNEQVFDDLRRWVVAAFGSLPKGAGKAPLERVAEVHAATKDAQGKGRAASFHNKDFEKYVQNSLAAQSKSAGSR